MMITTQQRTPPMKYLSAILFLTACAVHPALASSPSDSSRMATVSVKAETVRAKGHAYADSMAKVHITPAIRCPTGDITDTDNITPILYLCADSLDARTPKMIPRSYVNLLFKVMLRQDEYEHHITDSLMKKIVMTEKFLDQQ
jgi:hypothetical protein